MEGTECGRNLWKEKRGKEWRGRGARGAGREWGPGSLAFPPPLRLSMQSTFARPEASEGKKKCNNPKIAAAMQRLDRQRCAQTPGDSYSTFALQCLKKSTRRTEK